MPTYDYVCSECEMTHSFIHRISDEPREICPTCGTRTLRRLVAQQTAFVLKGKGWAKDGYR